MFSSTVRKGTRLYCWKTKPTSERSIFARLVVTLLNLPLYLLSRQIRSMDFKVVLSGDGADEILGGYDYFKLLKLDDRSEERRVGKECRSRWSPYH